MEQWVGRNGKCKTPFSCCTPIKIDSNNCTGSGQIGHQKNNYGKIGFSPCGEYVSHQTDMPCKDLVFDTSEIDFTIVHDCQCRTALCDCGDFLSHKISEPCTAR